MLDKSSGVVDRSSKSLTDLKNSLNIIDAWRFKNCNTIEYTYIDPSDRNKHSRIDFILLSKPLQNLAHSCTIIQSPAPDHKAVSLKLELKTNTRGRGYWKLNNSILNHKEYEKAISELCDNITREYDQVPKALLWDYLKFKIKKLSISYSIEQNKKMKTTLNDLEQKLSDIDQKIAIEKIN